MVNRLGRCLGLRAGIYRRISDEKYADAHGFGHQ
jgi:hypothetical protein